MANITTNHAPKPSFNPLRALGDAMLSIMMSAANSNKRLRELERLSAMTDEQLAARGLRREDIARFVFGDMYLV